jgi:prevent-host-death family protein
MTTVTFTELRNNAKKYFDSVESGETLSIYRNGKPVAILSPFAEKSPDRWKRGNPQKIPGIALSKAIMKERKESR